MPQSLIRKLSMVTPRAKTKPELMQNRNLGLALQKAHLWMFCFEKIIIMSLAFEKHYPLRG